MRADDVTDWFEVTLDGEGFIFHTHGELNSVGVCMISLLLNILAYLVLHCNILYMYQKSNFLCVDMLMTQANCCHTVSAGPMSSSM